MKNKKLFEILTLVKCVRSRRWDDVKKIVGFIPPFEVKEKKWGYEYKQDNSDYPLDLSKIETWSTYDDCIDIVFLNENNKLVCFAEDSYEDYLETQKKLWIAEFKSLILSV